MCIAIYLQPNAVITDEQFNNCADSNGDGFGLAFVDNGRLMVRRTMDRNEFKKMYDYVNEAYAYSPKILHFRITSVGETNLENCHPFNVSDDICFIHNGTISKLKDTTGRSDTNIFCEDVLKKIHADCPNFLHNSAIMSLIEDRIGYSKIIFLTSDNEYCILNESSGHWNTEKTIWFSNSSYKTFYKPVNNTYDRHNSNWSYHRYPNKYKDDCVYGIPRALDNWLCNQCQSAWHHSVDKCSCGSAKLFGDIYKGTVINPGIKQLPAPPRSRSVICSNCFKRNEEGISMCRYCYEVLEPIYEINDTTRTKKDYKNKFNSIDRSKLITTNEECSYCSGDDVVFGNIIDGLPVYLCAECAKVLANHDDKYFPKHLLDENFLEIKGE